MSYAEVVRFVSVQPFPLQQQLLLSPILSYSLVCFANLFLSYSLNPRLFCLISYLRLFRAFSPSFRSFHRFLFLSFSASENCTVFSEYGYSFFENDRAKQASKYDYFCTSFPLPWNFQCTSLGKMWPSFLLPCSCVTLNRISYLGIKANISF